MKKQVLLLFTVLISIQSFAAVIYVNIAATGNNDGSSWQNAYTDLQDALTIAIDNDSICIAEGIYYPTEDETGDANPADPRDKEFRMENKSVSIFGGYEGVEIDLSNRNPEMFPVILSGDIGTVGDKTDNCIRVLLLDNIDSGRLEGVTVSSSYSDNLASSGFDITDYAGIVVSNSSGFKMYNCIIENNECLNYGGNNFDASEMEIMNCTFKNNSSVQGGAFYASNCSLQIYNTEVSFNSCSDYGGAISLNGIQSGGEIIFSNSLFYNNKSYGTSYAGGAIHSYNISVPVKVINCTFVNNISNSGGGNSINSNLVDYEIYNSIFWSTNSNSHLNLLNTSYSFTVNNSIEQGIDAYPQFVDTSMSAYDFTFSSSSSAVDIGDTAGVSQYLPSEDFYGNYRFDGAIDAGVFETCTSTIDLNTSLNGATISSDQNGGNYQWIDCSDNLPIAGATNQSFTPNQSGDYSCIVTNGCVTDTTNCVSIMDVGLDENLPNATKIQVYPNPVSDILNIESSTPIAQVSILSVTGREMIKSRVQPEVINTSKLPSGVYFVKIYSEGQVSTRKLIKK